jgi:hypothetical protein
MYLWYYRGKSGGCRQIPTQKNVSESKMCRHDRGILAKCADIWLSGRHVADMSATFSAKDKTMGRVLYKCGVTIKMKPRLIRLTYVCLDV